MRWKVLVVLFLISLPGCMLASAWVTVSVSTPANNATVTSPTVFTASATSNRPVTAWRIYVDSVSRYQAGATSKISTSISMAAGTHKVTVRAWTSDGAYGSAYLTESVASTSTPQPSITPTSLPFGSVAVNATSASQAITVTNTGTATLNITGVSISPSQFKMTGPTSTSLAPGSSYVYTVTFTPTATSTYSGSMAFSTNSATSVPAVALSGTGATSVAQGSDSPTSVAFGAVTTGTTSTAQTVKLTNTGNATLTVSGLSISPSQFSVSGPTSTSIAPGSSVAYSVAFTPASATGYSGSLSFSTNSATAVSPVGLSGTGATGSSSNPNCTATTYYVSTSGSDGNSGISTSLPWKTVAKVVGYEPNLRAGDCVLFQRGGTWYEQLTISNIHGSQSASITFGNYGSGNLPVLDGSSSRPYGIIDGGSSGQAASSYVTIDGFEVRNATSGGIIFSYLAQPGITIKNNYVHHNGYGAYPGACAGCFQVDSGSYGYNEGIAFVGYPVGSYGARIINNIVTVEGGHNAIMVDQDTGSPLIQGNQVGPGCSHNCIDFKRSIGVMVKQNKVNCNTPVTVNGQTYKACNMNAFYTENTNSSVSETATLERNIAYGAVSGGACFGLQAKTGPISAQFYNNTCYAGSTGMNDYVVTSCLGGSLDIKNNIFDGGNVNLGTCPVSWDYNDNRATNAPSGAHDLSSNPLFVNPGAMDFHLQSTSLVLNTGNSSILGLTYMGPCGTSGVCP